MDTTHLKEHFCVYFFTIRHRARELLSNGEILNSKIQPYEAHIPYILKFFIDYNLQGMNFIYVANVDFRCEYENAYIDPKITTCEIEADCIAAEILNNQCLTNDGVNPGLKLILEEERNRRRKESLPSQITPQPSQERNHNEINLKEQSYLVQLRNIVNSYSQSNDIKLSDKSNYSDDELINDASDETFNASEDFIGIVMDLNNISTVSKSRDIVCADSKPSKNDRQTFNDSSINTNSNDESTLNCHPSQSSMGQLSYKTNDLAEMMMRFTNLSGEIDASFEDEDERNLTKEMLQVFKDIDSETNFTHVPQNSPLDLSISSDTENYSDFDVAIKDQNLNSGNNTTLKETNVNNELFAELCDCNSNQCCDICCDKISDGCNSDCENEECSKFLNTDSQSEQPVERYRKKEYNISFKENERQINRNSSVICEVGSMVIEDEINLSKLNNIPQIDGSFDDFSLCRRKSRKRKLSLAPLPLKETRVLRKTCNNGKLLNNGENFYSSTQISSYNTNNFERVTKTLNGEKVQVLKLIDESLFEKIGNEILEIHKLSPQTIKFFSNRSEAQEDTSTFLKSDCQSFFKTNLKGRKKLEFLRTLCRPLEVEVKFLDSCEKEDDQDSNFSGETTINGNLNDEFHEHNDLSYFDGCTQICSKINGEIEFKNDEEATQDYWDNDFLKNDEDQQLFSKDENTKLEQEENEENAASLNEVSSSQKSCNSQISLFGDSFDDTSSENIKSFYDFSAENSPYSSQSKSLQSFIEKSTPFLRKKSRLRSESFNSNSSPLQTINEGKIMDKHDSNQRTRARVTNKFIKKPKSKRKFMDSSLIEGPSHSDTFDFDISSFESSFKVGKESNSNNQYITTMCLEVFTSVCGDLKPNPINDSLRAVFYAINYDIPDDVGKKLSLGIILIKTDVTITQTQSNKDSLVYSRKHLLRSAFLKSDVDILYACDEIELYMKLIDIMKVNDPDILVGYEIEMSSWGFLLQRANALNIRIFSALSRVAQEEDDVTGPTLENIEKFGIKITGRIVLNLW
ncbi:DNA polymerase zeta catalytic subunit-like isoform X3, partial [Dinothrombium tinctorium]